MSTQKFYKGQIITRRSDTSKYAITTDKAIMKVIRITGNADNYYNLRVKIIDHKEHKAFIGEVHEVDAQFFRPLYNSIKRI